MPDAKRAAHLNNAGKTNEKMRTGPDLSFAPVENASVEHLFLEKLELRKITADVLRLDKIHPVVSGNKLFKLRYYLEDAMAKGFQSITTYGGAWSNHIVAAAFFTNQLGLRSTGIIRGEKPAELSSTLLQAAGYGMELRFVSRRSYADTGNNEMLDQLGITDSYLIPAGGAGDFGVRGSLEILSLADKQPYSHILCSIGTGTMFTGLAIAAGDEQQVIGIPAIKGINRLESFLQAPVSPDKYRQCRIITHYHFGGYAKKSPELLQFMNEFYVLTGIPTDFVYTGKLVFACIDLVEKDYFPPGSNLLIIHSGGLQGNASLASNALVF
jgi:1-aminocyclopropane-1-carboxylate deaminase